MHCWNIVVVALSHCGSILFIYLLVFLLLFFQDVSQQQHWIISHAADHSDMLISQFFFKHTKGFILILHLFMM